MTAALVLGLLACGAGQLHYSQIDDVRVVTAVADPAEGRPGTLVEVDVIVADPKMRQLEVLAWTCTPFDGTCLESELVDLEEWVSVHEVVDASAKVERVVPIELETYRTEIEAALGEELDDISTQMWLLACVVGTCGVITEARAVLDGVVLLEDDPVEGGLVDHNGPAAQASAEDALIDDSADPYALMDGLPMDGTSLVTRAYPVEMNVEDGLNVNPSFDARFAQALDDTLVVERGAELELAFMVEDANGESVWGYPYTTLGSFDVRRDKASDSGEVRVFLRAPESAGHGRAFVVFDDRDGGLAAFHMPLEVR